MPIITFIQRSATPRRVGQVKRGRTGGLEEGERGRESAGFTINALESRPRQASIPSRLLILMTGRLTRHQWGDNVVSTYAFPPGHVP